MLGSKIDRVTARTDLPLSPPRDVLAWQSAWVSGPVESDETGNTAPLPSREIAELLDRNALAAQRWRRWNSLRVRVVCGALLLGTIGFAVSPGPISDRLVAGLLSSLGGAVLGVRLSSLNNDD